MKPFQLPELDTDYVDTPRGVLTPGGLQFHVRADALNSWAGELFRHVSLRELLAGVSAWQSVPSTVVLWLAPLAMFWFDPLNVAIVSLLLVPVLRAIAPPLINPPLINLTRYLGLAGVQGLFYITALTVLSRVATPVHVFLALGVFVVLRTGIADVIFTKIGDWAGNQIYKLAPVDVSLRTLIINTAAQYGIELEGFEEFGTRRNLFSKKS